MKKSILTIFMGLFIICLLLAQSNPTPVENALADTCACEGNYVKLTLLYFGEEEVNIAVYFDEKFIGLVQKSISPIKKGAKVKIIAKYNSRRKLNSKTYLVLENLLNEQKVVVLPTSCPPPSLPAVLAQEKIIGKFFGDFMVLSYEDESGNVCSIDDLKID